MFEGAELLKHNPYNANQPKPLADVLPISEGRLQGEVEYDRVRENFGKLPPITELRDEWDGILCIAGGGPSLKDDVKTIKRLKKKRGAKLLTVNKVHDYLLSKALPADFHAVLDPMPWIAEYVQKPMKARPGKKTTKYLVASQVHPDTIDALSGTDAYEWHCQSDYIVPEWLKKTFPHQSWACIPNWSSTVAMRSIEVGHFLGFREIHLFGVDSCFDVDGNYAPFTKEHFGEGELTVMHEGKEYLTNRDMARQAEEFVQMVRKYDEDMIAGHKEPFVTIVHGTGLIPDIARTLFMHADQGFSEWNNKAS